MTTKESFQDKIKKAKRTIECTKASIRNWEARIQYMEDNKTDKFDEDEFKVYQTISLLEDNPEMSRSDKAKAIASLIKK